MRYWWVSQNQTYRHEVHGGYLWSPKRNQDGARNPFYESMREVSPGDVVFSFAGTFIRAYGIASSYAYEAPKPLEFGGVGRNWDDIGWRVDVCFEELASTFRPRDWIERLRPLLPERYSPLLRDGRGAQMYLAEISEPLALVLAELSGPEVLALARAEVVAEQPAFAPNVEVLLWEEHLRAGIESDVALAPTEREALVLARRGQGLFRQRVQEREPLCRVTRVDRAEHLRASHCKPWRDSSNAERLNADNGLMLTPSIDHLFDSGFISFDDDGRLLIAPVAHRLSLARMGVETERETNVGEFSPEQHPFLEYHRDAVFRRSRLRSA